MTIGNEFWPKKMMGSRNYNTYCYLFKGNNLDQSIGESATHNEFQYKYDVPTIHSQ